MIKKLPYLLIVFIFIGFIILLAFLIRQTNLPLIKPQGLIAIKERNLIVLAVGLLLFVAIPVVLSTFFIAWKYRQNNTKSKYKPDSTGSNFVTFIWWSIPTLMCLIFFVIVWQAAHQLDPFRAIESNVKPITIQVVALDWKWLFIYPKENIATVNFVEFPVHTPVNFQLTADAPMNSFWIPSLGGQIYAMSTMQTQLHLLSDKTGDFKGGAAEINGAGFAGMRFTARVSEEEAFNSWVDGIKKSGKSLDIAAYNELAKPSENTPVTYYSSVEKDLYNRIIMQYMEPEKKLGD